MTIIEIKYCDIPTFLREGDFFRNLDSDDPEGIIQIPADCFHHDGKTAADLEEFRQLLKVMVFWVLDEIPNGVLEFCNAHEVGVWGKSLVDLPGALEVEIRPLLLLVYSNAKDATLEDVLKTGRWDLIMHAVARIDKNSNATSAAASYGNLRLLKYLHEEGFTWGAKTCQSACRNGHLECLRYAHENGCPWDADIYVYLAAGGHLSCLQYAFEQGLQWHADVCREAAMNGHLNCLQFAHENGCPWDTETTRSAAEKGHLDCLKFAEGHGCGWNVDTTAVAAQNGHTQCLLYALEHGCPVDEEACSLACKNGYLQCLQVLHQFGTPWSERTSWHAAINPAVECLQYLHENGCPWDEKTPGRAAVIGNIEPLRYAMEHGCTYNGPGMLRSISSSNLVCLKYLVEEQILCLSEAAFLCALFRGDLICLQYLLDQGCPYKNAETVVFVGFPGGDVPRDVLFQMLDGVFRKDNPEFVLCVEYAVQRGWVISDRLIDYVVSRDMLCTEWLIKEGLYVDEGRYFASVFAKRKYDELLSRYITP